MNQAKADFYKGMDISSLPELLDEGMQVKDFDGTPMDSFVLLQKYGVNSIRLRIWNKPENIPESKGYCDLQHTLQMAKRIKAHGMHFLLDFHYSDFWADPGQQRKPKEWEGLSFQELEEAVFTYTRDTLLALQREGVLPDVVQIGNEIRSGLLFPDGELPNYPQMVRLVNAGICGARAVAGKECLKVMIHLDQGGRYFYLKEWFSRAFENGLKDFDIIGLSYYPFWHGTFTDLRTTMERLLSDFGKPIMVVETAYAWRSSNAGFIDEAQERIAGFEATPQNQEKVLDLVMNIVASLPNKMGQGIYYWEPLSLPLPGQGGWGENMGLLNEEGRVMEGIRAFLFSREKQRCEDCAKVYQPQTIIIRPGQLPELPKEVQVLYYDGTIRSREVIWEDSEVNADRPGTYQVAGSIKGIAEKAKACVQIEEELPPAENLISDSNWNDGLARWEMTVDAEKIFTGFYPEFADPFPAPPINALRVEGSSNFSFQISQRVWITQSGRYRLTVEFKGTDTTGVDVRMFAHNEAEKWETVIHPTEHGWTVHSIENIVCERGYLTVGISIQAPPMYGMMRKFCLVFPAG